MLISITLPLLTSVLILLYLESNIVYGGGLTLNDLPIINDSTLKVELIYEGNFSVQPGQSSPVSTMTFLGSDILILSKNDGAIYRIRNGTIVDEPLRDVNVRKKRERRVLGIAAMKKTEANAEYIFVY